MSRLWALGVHLQRFGEAVTPATTTRNLLLMLLAATIGAPPVAAQPAWQPQSEEPHIAEVRLGFDHVYKLGCWSPIEVDLVGGTKPFTGRLLITVPDSDGVPTSVVSPAERPVGVQPGQSTTVRLYVRVGQSMSTVRVRFVADGKVRSERKFHAGLEPGGSYVSGGIPATNRLLLQFGPALGLGDLVRDSQPDNELTRTRVTRLENAVALPTRWFGYEGVDTVLLCTSQPELYRPLLQNRARVEALRQWVEGGGRLVIFCGQEAEELLGDGGVLAELAPGDFEKMVPLRQSLPIEAFQRLERAGDSQSSARLACAQTGECPWGSTRIRRPREDRSAARGALATRLRRGRVFRFGFRSTAAPRLAWADRILASSARLAC